MTPEIVFIPPESDPTLSRSAVNVLVSLEHVLQQTEDYRSDRAEDVRQGLRDLVIEEPMVFGAVQMLERFAISSRLRVWITSAWFGKFGEAFVPPLETWLQANHLTPRVLDWIGYTNVLVPDAIIYDPQAVSKSPGQISESDLFQLRLDRMRRQYV